MTDDVEHATDAWLTCTVTDSFKALRPFISFYGAKWRASKHYPVPRYRTIVEPFAGSAGYSLRYHWHDVVLNDLDRVIYRIWRDLIDADESDIRAIPTDWEAVMAMGESGLRDMARFWFNKGATTPSSQPSSWMRSGKWDTQFWGEHRRALMASQVAGIDHWRVTNLSYRDIDVEAIGAATWFVDPPYQSAAGRHYRHDSIDFEALGAWCRSLPGQVIVCEQEGADWLDFKPFKSLKSRRGQSQEVVWLRG